MVEVLTVYGMHKSKKVPLCIITQTTSFYCARALKHLYNVMYDASDYFLLPNPPPPDCQDCDVMKYRTRFLKDLENDRCIYVAWKGWMSNLRLPEDEVDDLPSQAAHEVLEHGGTM